MQRHEFKVETDEYIPEAVLIVQFPWFSDTYDGRNPHIYLFVDGQCYWGDIVAKTIPSYEIEFSVPSPEDRRLQERLKRDRRLFSLFEFGTRLQPRKDASLVASSSTLTSSWESTNLFFAGLYKASSRLWPTNKPIREQWTPREIDLLSQWRRPESF